MKAPPASRRPRRGFTFIELTTVWLIIAILAAMLFPVFAKAREKARQVNCSSNLLNIGVALRAYAQDHAGHFPSADNDLWALVPRDLPDPRALLCPSAVGSRAESTTAAAEAPPAGRSDYVYVGGWCDDDRPDALVAGDDVLGRHNDGANYLFLDGHAKWVLPPEKARGYGYESTLEGVPGWKKLDGLRKQKREGAGSRSVPPAENQGGARP